MAIEKGFKIFHSWISLRCKEANTFLFAWPRAYQTLEINQKFTHSRVSFHKINATYVMKTSPQPVSCDIHHDELGSTKKGEKRMMNWPVAPYSSCEILHDLL